jgi:hypothetical protein
MIGCRWAMSLIIYTLAFATDSPLHRFYSCALYSCLRHILAHYNFGSVTYNGPSDHMSALSITFLPSGRNIDHAVIMYLGILTYCVFRFLLGASKFASNLFVIKLSSYEGLIC